MLENEKKFTLVQARIKHTSFHFRSTCTSLDGNTSLEKEETYIRQCFPEDKLLPRSMSALREPKITIVFILPGIGIPTLYYTEFARTLAENDCVCVIVDIFDYEKTSSHSAKSKNSISHVIFHKLVPLMEHYSDEFKPYGSISFVVCGHSLGGVVALFAQDILPTRVKACITLATGSYYYQSYGRQKWNMKILYHTLLGVVSVKGYKPKTRFESFGEIPGPLIRDLVHLGLHGGDDVPSMRQREKAVKRNIPTLLLSFHRDPYVPQSSVNDLRTQFRLQHATRKHIRDTSGHSEWALEPKETTFAIIRWLLELD